jgi:hypothetical protein
LKEESTKKENRHGKGNSGKRRNLVESDKNQWKRSEEALDMFMTNSVRSVEHDDKVSIRFIAAE